MTTADDPPDLDPLWDFQYPDQSQVKFIAALEKGRAVGDQQYCAQSLSQIARAQGLQRKFDEAHRMLDEAWALIEGSASPRSRVRILLERGRLHNSASNPTSAAPLFQTAFNIAAAAGEDFLAIDAAHMLGICLPPDQAIAWNEKSLALARDSSDPRARKWTGSILNNLGWTYHDKGDFDRALDLFRQGYELRKAQNQPLETRIARYTIARTLRSMGKLDESLTMQRELEQEWRAAGAEDGYVFEELAECLLALNRAAEAQAWFAKAYASLSKDPWLAANESNRLDRLKKLSEGI